MRVELAEAQALRDFRLVCAEIDGIVDRLDLGADSVSPADKKKLAGLLKHYAKQPKPFTACVRDNTKRFGKDGAERVCATLKDVIRGTTKWRKGNQTVGMSEDLGEVPEIDDEMRALILRHGETLEALVMEAMYA